MPVFRNIHIRDISCETAKVAVEMFGLADADTIHDVTIEDVVIASRVGVRAEYVRGLRLKRVALEPEQSPTIRLIGCRDVTLEQLACPEGTEVFLQVEGAVSTNIRLNEIDPSGAARDVVLGKDVAAEAVIINPAN